MAPQTSVPTNSSLNRKAQRMMEISCELNSSADLETLLRVIMDAATELTDSEAASVILLDPHTRDLYFAATSRGSSPDLIGMVVPLDTSIAGDILKREQPVIVPDVSTDPRHHKQISQAIDHETRSLLGVPMLAEERKVGVLEAINKIHGPYSPDDVQTLSTLASLAALAIHKAGLIAQLEEANRQLSELDRLKSNFIAIASHELRTPLTIILGYVSLLKDQIDGHEIEGALAAAMRLRRLMEDMFNLRYIDAGESQLNLTRFCLANLAQDTVKERNNLAEAKEHTLSLEAPSERCEILADRDAVRVVLSNLISNAIRFTPAGGEIHLTVTDRPHEIWVAVRDNGIGIPQQEQKRIFNRFYQVEHHMTRQHGGMGLGLAIASELLALQQGRIWVESQVGKGSTFTFALPCADGVEHESS